MPYEGETDRDLAVRFAAGDVEAFNVLHRRHYAKVYRLAYMQTNHADDAEDIASETFCRAFLRLKQVSFAGGDSIYPWLHRIVVNLSIDLCRNRTAHQMISLDAETSEGVRSLIETLDSEKPSPFELVQRQEVLNLVRSSIAALVEDQRDVIAYRFIGELSLRETAEAMRRTESATKSLTYRAMQSLRKEILKRVSESERMRLLGRGGDRANVRGEDIRIHKRTS